MAVLMILEVKGSDFVAEATIDRGDKDVRVLRAEPRLEHMQGWSLDHALADIHRRGWEWKIRQKW